MKLAYSEKYNQFYEIMRIDNDVGVCYIKPTSNKRDKSIHRDMILKIDTEDGFEIVVMHNANITAEQHFVKIMESDCPDKIKLSELRDFKRNMLRESSVAMDELKKISEMQQINIGQQEVKNLALTLLCSKKENVIIKDSAATYENQDIPANTMKMALSKRIFIERSDEIYKKRDKTEFGKLVLSVGKKRQRLQTGRPCGFLIRDKEGNVLVGKKYTMTIQDVIEFVNNYIPDEKAVEEKYLYKVPMSEKKEHNLMKCANILKSNGLHYKNEHNYFFWVLDKQGKVVAGGKNGFGFKWLRKYCNRLDSGAIKRVTDKVQRSNR